MSTLTLPMSLETAVCDRGIAFLGAPAQRSAKKRLSGSTVEVVKTVSSLVDEMVEEAVCSKSAAEFRATFDDVFPKYVALCVNLGRLVSTMVPRNELVRLSGESYCELEADIRDHAEATFGSHMKERALFTVWTLRKTSDLLQSIIDKQAVISAGDDRRYFEHFLFHALRSRFGIDCMRLSMHRQLRIYPDVLEMVADSLRSSVDAYAWAKQSLSLRTATVEQADPVEAWDDEDQELVNESMIDLGLQGH